MDLYLQSQWQSSCMALSRALLWRLREIAFNNREVIDHKFLKWHCVKWEFSLQVTISLTLQNCCVISIGSPCLNNLLCLQVKWDDVVAVQATMQTFRKNYMATLCSSTTAQTSLGCFNVSDSCLMCSLSQPKHIIFSSELIRQESVVQFWQSLNLDTSVA